MGHHYLPQHYLRGFASCKAIWVHDLRDSRSFKSQIKSVANETEMYPQDLETRLANDIEDPAQGIIDALRSNTPPNNPQREILAHYIIAMWKRVPAARQRVAATIPGVADTLNSEIQLELDRIARQEPEFSELALRRKREVDALISKYKENPPEYFWHQSIDSGATPKMVQALLDMQWTVLVADQSDFLTSDNPVFFFTSEGIGSPYSELSIPFGSRVALWASRGRPQRPPVLKVNRSTVLQINRRSASNAERYLYTLQESPWALRFGTKNHDLQRLW